MSKEEKSKGKKAIGCCIIVPLSVVAFMILILCWGFTLTKVGDYKYDELQSVWKTDKDKAVEMVVELIEDDNIYLLNENQRRIVFQQCVPYVIEKNDLLSLSKLSTATSEFPVLKKSVMFANDKQKEVWEEAVITVEHQNELQFVSQNLSNTKGTYAHKVISSEHKQLIEDVKAAPIGNIELLYVKTDEIHGLPNFGLMMETFIVDPIWSVETTKNGTEFVRVKGKLPEDVKLELSFKCPRLFRKDDIIVVDVYYTEYHPSGFSRHFIKQDSKSAELRMIMIDGIVADSVERRSDIIGYINMYGFRD